jgi:hypothetical protein
MLVCYLDSSSSGYAVASCLVLLGWEVLIAARRTHVLILCDVLGSSFAVCWLRVALVVSSGHISKPVAVGCPGCAGQQISKV